MAALPDGTYQLTNLRHGSSLCPADHADAHGDRRAWVKARPGHARQGGDSMWRLERQKGGAYKIFSVKRGGPLCCASKADKAGDRRAWVKAHRDYDDDGDALWWIIEQPNGTFKLINASSGCVLYSSYEREDAGGRKAWGKKGSTYDDAGNACWAIKTGPKASAFLSSNGSPNEVALREVVRDFWAKAPPTESVSVIGFFDAKDGELRELMRNSDMFQTVLRVARQVANTDYEGRFSVRGSAYRFGKVCLEDGPERRELMERCRERCCTRGSIAVMVGGNTYALAHGMKQAPEIFDAIRTNVHRGSLLYASFSAGTCFAGVTTQIARDPVTDLDGNPIEMVKNGLGICDLVFRPHASGATALAKGAEIEQKMQDGTLTDDAGNRINRPVVYLRDDPKDCYSVVHGKLHSSSTILKPCPHPAPFSGM